jgi:holo-[acyl-carrier protein] synthase
MRFGPFSDADEMVHVVRLVTGIDIQPFDEVEESLARFGGRYLRRICSEREIAECLAHHATMVRGLAVRFAAKEAVLKALTPHDHIPPWRSIEVLYDSNAVPSLALHGEAERLARQRCVEEMRLSVGFGLGYAIATVMGDVISDRAGPDE